VIVRGEIRDILDPVVVRGEIRDISFLDFWTMYFCSSGS
jgi:hypothetical protein